MSDGTRTVDRREAVEVTLTTVLLALEEALQTEVERRARANQRNPYWKRDLDDVSVSAQDVAFKLGLWTVQEVEPEWCGECHKLTREARSYPSVSSGQVARIGRMLRPHYTLTAGGSALLDDAHEIAAEHVAEALS